LTAATAAAKGAFNESVRERRFTSTGAAPSAPLTLTLIVPPDCEDDDNDGRRSPLTEIVVVEEDGELRLVWMRSSGGGASLPE
jgi:hypothetical protein